MTRDAGWDGDAPDSPSEAKERYVLKLYVTGRSPNSTRAVVNIKRLCERYLAGRYDLRIVDLYQRPELARGQQIIAAPTLIKEWPLPVKRILGDMSDERRVLSGLDIERST